ncbi:MAG: hypothetical protein ABI068_17270 [Ktedonobacterales bacterium]
MALLDTTGMAAKSVTAHAVNWLRPFASLAAPDAASALQPLPIKRIAVQATGIWLVTRIAFMLITMLARAFGLVHAPTALSIFSGNPNYAPLVLPLLAGHPLLASWVHYDASWYLLIATHGYDTFTTDSTGFFPMYPLQIHLLTLLFGQQSALPIAMALSNLAALAAFIGLGLLAAHEGSGVAAGAASGVASSTEHAATTSARLIRVVAAYPFAFFLVAPYTEGFFLVAPYTEGFFLACVVFSFLCARRGWWRWAAVCAILAGLTRPTAFALVPALAWEYGRQHGVWQRASWRRGAWRSLRWLRSLSGGVAVAAAAPAGLGCYLLYLQLLYGNPLTPFTAQMRYHGHRNWPVWQTLGELVHRFFNPPPLTPPVALLYLDGGLLILFLIITLLNARRLPLFYTFYMLATIYLLLSTPIPHRPELIPSAGRYLLMAIPIFLLVSRWIRQRPSLEILIIVVGFMLQTLFTMLFISGAWVE